METYQIFSNFWGLLTLPLLTWGSITLIQKRIGKSELSGLTNKDGFPKPIIAFLASLTFGIILSLSWEFDLEYILQYLILLPIVVSLFRPIHFPQYLLGFLLGMVILLMCFITYSMSRGVLFLISKVV